MFFESVYLGTYISILTIMINIFGDSERNGYYIL